MSLKEIFENSDLKILFFGGKGGVGKTTCAASASIWLAQNLKKKILVISTDPAHSLGDSLGQTLIAGEITKVNGVDNLWGLEIDPEKEQNQMRDLISMLPQEDIFFSEELKGLTEINPPGIDEALAFGKVLEFVDNDEYDIIIFDTAPTGHTLRLLSIPDILSSWIGKLLMFKMRIGKLFGTLKGIFKRDSEDSEEKLDAFDSLRELRDKIEKAKKILTSPQKTSFVICTIAEAMSIYETERLLSSLIEYDIPTKYIVVNQLYPEYINCEFCQKRRKMQQKHLNEIRDIYGKNFNIIETPLFEEEIRNIDKLEEFSKYLF
ncbi:MAG: ArsA family ATPase [Promethearchaeota archaeon]